MIGLTETWLKLDEFTVLNEASPPGYTSDHGGDLCGLYSALSQDGKLVVEDISLVVWGLCFGKVGGVISFLFGPVRGCPRMGPQCLLSPPVSASSIYAAVVCVGGLGSVCYIWSTSPVLFGVLCESKCAFSNSLLLSFSLSEDLSPRTMPQDYLT